MTFIFWVHSLLFRFDALRHSRSSPSDKPPVLTLADLTPGGSSFTKSNSLTSHQRKGIHMSSTYPESTDLFDKKVYYYCEHLHLVQKSPVWFSRPLKLLWIFVNHGDDLLDCIWFSWIYFVLEISTGMYWVVLIISLKPPAALSP